MERPITELYRRDEPMALQRRARAWIVVAALVGVAALAACAGLCALARPSNWRRLLLYTAAVSTLGGWIVITLSHFVIAELKHAQKHVEAVRDGAREPIDGRIVLTDERIRVKNGVAMRRARVEGSEGSRSVQVYEKKAAKLRGVRTARVYATHGFVTAYEADDGD